MLGCFPSANYFAATSTTLPTSLPIPITWHLLVIGLLGGLALFLYGLDKMSDALKNVAGDQLRDVLHRLTRNRFAGLLTGTVVTGITQSSSLTTVLLVGFVSAGLMTMQQSVAVVMGSNVGTTINTQLIAFQVAKYALLFVVVGYAGQTFLRSERMCLWSRALLGLGLLFVGMEMMSQAMRPLQHYPLFLQWMAQMRYAWIGLFVGALFTALIQSSAATVGVVIALASQGLVDLKAGLAISLGANVGTCVTAVLASLRQPAEARQVAIVHVLFNFCGVILFLPFLGPFASLISSISPQAPDLQGAARIAYEAPRQIANAHTLFNLICALLFIGFTPTFAWLAQKLSPKPDEDAQTDDEMRFMLDTYLSDPSLAMTMARKEIDRYGHRLIEMIELIPQLHGVEPESSIRQIRQLGGRIGHMHQKMLNWLSALGTRALSPAQSEELLTLIRVVNAYQSMSSRITQELLRLDWEQAAKERRKQKDHEPTDLFVEIQKRLVNSTELTLRAVTEKDLDAAKQVLDLRDQIDKYARQAQIESIQRLKDHPEKLEHAPALLEIDSLEILKQLHYFNRRIARSQIRLLSPP
ncbi:MAG: Na/Pi cotransporter family protein [Myxococcales bacterium]|nr:Na/Pi cotransporter family protein [Myxococcales bacterium]MCB9644842.1 Na/Pi cotransporter family protein [Myxococcales bacterium]